jgi:ubiquinone/menaquinone biosynthesis C-methylase UbiE
VPADWGGVTGSIAPAVGLRAIATDFWVSRALHVAVKLGLPDLLADGPKSVDALAAQIGANADALFRLMRVLAVHNIFVEQNEKRFGLTDWGNMLRSDKPGSMRDYVLLAGEPAAWRACEDLEFSVMTGKAAFDHTLGQSWFTYLDANPTIGRIFDNAMRSRGAADDAAILNVFDFSKFRRIADLGAGEGGLLSATLQTVPQANGILFDQPRVVENARRLLADRAVSGRIEFVAGDLFDAVPTSADLYILKQILHDWSDEQAQKILATCRRAMSSGSRLLVLEMLVEPDADFPKRLDLMMMVWTGGRERTQQEFEHLLSNAGFRLICTNRTVMPICVLEAELA